MSKRFDTSGMYPGKRNPGGSPTTGRTNDTPQGKAGETPVQVPVRPGTVQNRGDRARESYAPPTRTRPTTKPNTTPAQTPASPKPAQTPASPKPAQTPQPKPAPAYKTPRSTGESRTTIGEAASAV